MIRKLVVVLLTGIMCLVGITSALAVTYNEAPMLRVKVAAGELAPVEERLPEEPGVAEPIEEIGRYGGTLTVFATNNMPWNDLTECPETAGTFLLKAMPDGTVVGNVAKGYKLSDDAKNITIYLRKGMKWSDGMPFTADDIIFTYEDVAWNDKVQRWGPHEPVKSLKKIDDYTVRFEFDEPQPSVVQYFAMYHGSEWSVISPKHYLKNWHIKYNPEADELAKKEGFANWWDAFKYHNEIAPQRDLDKPTLRPWIFKESTTTYKLFERNPYYYEVDKAGNQLPYVDRIVSYIVDAEVYQMKVITGEADVAMIGTLIENYALYKENEKEGGYRVVAIPGILGARPGFGINQTHPDPALCKILRDVRFRQALSLAINREEINEVCYFGLGVPSQATILPSVSYYKKEWAEAYAQYDPDRANRLLNEVGLTKRDKDGFRIGPDGKALLLLVEYALSEASIPTSLYELVKEYWKDVGLKVMLKFEERGYFDERRQALGHIIIASESSGATEIGDYTMPESWMPEFPSVHSWGNAWHTWLKAKEDIELGKKTLQDFEGGKLPGEEPPDQIKQLVQWQKRRLQTVMGSKEYMELSQKIHAFHAENIYVIGTVGMVPDLLITKKDIGNVPKAYGRAVEWPGCIWYDAQQLFFKR